MTSKIEERITKLNNLILNRREEIGKRSGVPFIIFPYPPTSELLTIERIEAFIKKLEFNDIDVVKINMREMFFSILEDRGLVDSVIEVEKEGDEDLKKSLRSVFFEPVDNDLGPLPQWIIDKKDEGDVMVLYHLGVLYPFSSLSTLFTNFENKIDKTLIAFYPAEKEGKEIKFLGEADGSYYRAKVV